MTTPPLAAAGLRCAHHVDPLGVAPDRVRFSWLLEGAGDRRRQTAYQVQVATAESPLADGTRLAWDSGEVTAAASVDIAYAGAALIRGARYVWRVRVRDERGALSGWSDPAAFEVELDPVTGWDASWIGLGRIRESFLPPSGSPDPLAKAMTPAPYLRRAFTVSGLVASARLYATARGVYEPRINGCRVGDHVLAPGWTDYARRIHYQTYDVTHLLADGENVVGVLIADGWYAGFVAFDSKRAGAHYGQAPEFLAQLDITYADGRRDRVVTDGSWQARFGAIRHADLLMGELTDCDLEPYGWDEPGFDAAGWTGVRCRGRDQVLLAAEPGPPIRVTQEVTPRSVAHGPDGVQILDFGQNLTGWLRLTGDVTRPTTVTVRHGEELTPDGRLYTENLRTARQQDTFGNVRGPSVLEPRLTIHGFRFAEVTGWPDDLHAGNAVARVAHSDIPGTGAFTSSAPWLDQLFASIDWGQRGNFISVPTDCPQRDERLGWLGDAQIFARTAAYNRDVAAFLGKWLDDVADAQFPSGAYSDIAPRLHLGWAGAPAWGDAGVIVPWTLWRMYGDRSCLDRHFGAMTAWMQFLERGNPGYLRVRELGNSYNDWLAPGADDTPPELLATAYWAYDAQLMADISDAVGRAGDAADYRALWSKISSAFADAFVAADGSITSGTQTAHALALHMNLVPEDLRAAAAGHLVRAIESTNCRLTTGFVGVGYLLPVLSSNGYTDVAYRLLEQRELPSWRYMLEHGATTIWERWDGRTEERGFQSAAMDSFNHYALGSVGEWLYRFVLGIDLAPGGVAFDRLLVRPQAGGSLTSAAGSYRSVRGPIATSWSRNAGRFTFRIELPPNTTASVHLASADPSAVRAADGRGPDRVAAFPGAPGVSEAVFEIGSGTCEFAGPDCPAADGAAGISADRVQP